MIDKTAVEAGRKRMAKILRIIARVIGVIITMFFLAMLIGDGVQSIKEEGFRNITAESLYILVPVIIALAAFIVSWWREFSGGISLVLAYLIFSFAPSVHSLYYGEGPHFYIGMFFVALPFLVSGILFIVASRLSKRVSN
jgi:succinate dehydrogenase/fumarate reductase cytochrome b subunit